MAPTFTKPPCKIVEEQVKTSCHWSLPGSSGQPRARAAAARRYAAAAYRALIPRRRRRRRHARAKLQPMAARAGLYCCSWTLYSENGHLRNAAIQLPNATVAAAPQLPPPRRHFAHSQNRDGEPGGARGHGPPSLPPIFQNSDKVITTNCVSIYAKYCEMAFFPDSNLFFFLNGSPFVRRS